ncbi:hypothetical protein [Streptomyces sp. NPDC057939]|uniref:hypothetical protein n=1 Tax=Streptomyces sp. NPDC057939 TaxID=3346284 RepID=UPI0036ED0B5A
MRPTPAERDRLLSRGAAGPARGAAPLLAGEPLRSEAAESAESVPLNRPYFLSARHSL